MCVRALQRGPTAEAIGEGSVLGRPHAQTGIRTAHFLQLSGGFCRSGHGYIKILKLTSSAKFPLPCKVAYSQFLGIRIQTSSRGHESAYKV